MSTCNSTTQPEGNEIESSIEANINIHGVFNDTRIGQLPSPGTASNYLPGTATIQHSRPVPKQRRLEAHIDPALGARIIYAGA